MDDTRLRLKDYSCLVWLQQFPHWHLGVKFLPPTPPPPGVAATAAAAMSEGKDVDKAVSEARQKVGFSNQLVKCCAPKQCSGLRLTFCFRARFQPC